MPQMMPLNWILMFLQILLVTALIMITMYHTQTPQPKSYSPSIKTLNNTWKW